MTTIYMNLHTYFYRYCLVFGAIVYIMGCSSVYKKPENSTSVAIFKSDESVLNSIFAVDHYWHISKTKCETQDGDGDLDPFYVVGKEYTNWMMPSDMLKRIIEESRNREMRTTLKSNERVYLRAMFSTKESVYDYLCHSKISFIPEANTEYVLKQYIRVQKNGIRYRIGCGIDVTDTRNNSEPTTLLKHDMCGFE